MDRYYMTIQNIMHIKCANKSIHKSHKLDSKYVCIRHKSYVTVCMYALVCTSLYTLYHCQYDNIFESWFKQITVLFLQNTD